MRKKEKVTVIQDAENPILPEILAASLKSIGDAVRQWDRAGLKRRALIVLIHDQSKVPLRDIEVVLNNLVDMHKDWCIAPVPKNGGK